MTRLAKCVGISALALVAVVLIAACGRQSW